MPALKLFALLVQPGLAKCLGSPSCIDEGDHSALLQIQGGIEANISSGSSDMNFVQLDAGANETEEIATESGDEYDDETPDHHAWEFRYGDDYGYSPFEGMDFHHDARPRHHFHGYSDHGRHMERRFGSDGGDDEEDYADDIHESLRDHRGGYYYHDDRDYDENYGHFAYDKDDDNSAYDEHDYDEEMHGHGWWRHVAWMRARDRYRRYMREHTHRRWHDEPDYWGDYSDEDWDEDRDEREPGMRAERRISRAMAAAAHLKQSAAAASRRAAAQAARIRIDADRTAHYLRDDALENAASIQESAEDDAEDLHHAAAAEAVRIKLDSQRSASDFRDDVLENVADDAENMQDSVVEDVRREAADDVHEATAAERAAQHRMMISRKHEIHSERMARMAAMKLRDMKKAIHRAEDELHALKEEAEDINE